VKSRFENTIRAYASAWGARNRQQWLDTFAESATQEDPVGSGVRRGRDEIGGFWDRAMSAYESLEIIPREIFITDHEAAMVWTINATSGNGLVTFNGIDVFTFDDSRRILSARAYWDRRL